ncbi:MAG: ABC transporter ATP-binding protein [Gammaproteobacteria bacterium]|jgi:putative ABC transport system ATP-binding protein|nr:ABC transporter ATP-binding protein [Gammaproteobacteria bacterium]MBT3723769.1 ABC transporter ATP-binding protein [Gammaproteobacteria bacterium]MBT4075776.1 ABC transporter ATP-binding protein [Gammaproteobacteria bacterium]MBT4196437.1 ABC transporter ATP-binding protein [Gammaproteobacteria bacterium]MBT4448142.1 ABC transporter ATP-binding protein [Gammaproteobacteria bacterium]
MIKLENIHRDFQVGDQTVHALDDINMQISQGEYLSVMGPSGSGKSTLLNLIGLLDHATSGLYFLNDQNITDMDEQQEALTRNKHIGFVFQAFHLIPRLTAQENIELPLLLAGIEPDIRHDKVKKALHSMNLMDRAHHKPDQLSGGQRQRVAIARATITEPSVLLADEPTGNLDQKSGADVIETLESLNERGITLIVVTHDSHLGKRSTRAIKMVDGRIQSDQQNTR